MVAKGIIIPKVLWGSPWVIFNSPTPVPSLWLVCYWLLFSLWKSSLSPCYVLPSLHFDHVFLTFHIDSMWFSSELSDRLLSIQHAISLFCSKSVWPTPTSFPALTVWIALDNQPWAEEGFKCSTYHQTNAPIMKLERLAISIKKPTLSLSISFIHSLVLFVPLDLRPGLCFMWPLATAPHSHS